MNPGRQRKGEPDPAPGFPRRRFGRQLSLRPPGRKEETRHTLEHDRA